VKGSQEPDEYVRVRNIGNAPVNLDGWRLRDITTGFPEFLFPPHSLDPDVEVRVHTDEVHPEFGGFSFERGSAIWNNSTPDTAGLYSPSGQLISTRSYPPGC
jgi:hypothetical protein